MGTSSYQLWLADRGTLADAYLGEHEEPEPSVPRNYMGRDAIGIDLNPTYKKLATARCRAKRDPTTRGAS